MAFGDWTVTSGSWALYSADKYAGNSCVQGAATVNSTDQYLSRGSSSQYQVILWVRSYAPGGDTTYSKVRHPSYGTLTLQSKSGGLSDWEKFRVSFWYDSGANTKFGRIEKWVTDAWVQQGTDTNFGTGSPAASTIQLVTYRTYPGCYSLFDELEVYTA
jgi:hypothetical protein